MRVLAAAADDLDRDELVRLYAYPDPPPRGGWVRANMVTSLDGAVSGADGLSGSISTPADRQVFSVLRGHADVVVAGAGTVRAEGYSRPTAKPEDAARRRAAGRAPRPCLAVVTSSGEVPANLLEAPGRDEEGWRVVVLTTTGTDGSRVDRLCRALGDDCVLQVGADEVDPRAAVDALVALGLPRVLCEGGPTLLAEVTATGVLDELCLTLSPVLVAGAGPRILKGPPLLALAELSPASVLEEDGFLFLRYLRRVTDSVPSAPSTS